MASFDVFLFGLGCAGGLIPDILRLIKNRHTGTTPAYFKKVFFWLGLVLMVALGGFAAWVMQATDVKEALTFGFAAPQVFSSLAAKSEGVKDRGAMEPSRLGLRTWWSN
jgi:hypothetical protein